MALLGIDLRSAMGYSSIKDIKVSDFQKILQILEKENLNKNHNIINEVPDIIIPFGKYKGKSFKEII